MAMAMAMAMALHQAGKGAQQHKTSWAAASFRISVLVDGELK